MELDDFQQSYKSLKSAEKEAVNRAEAVALLLLLGFRVYRPEVDVHGEDFVVRGQDGRLFGVQLKSRPYVEWQRYGERGLWMLFPDPQPEALPRRWFLIEHDRFYPWVTAKHGSSPKWEESWGYSYMTSDLESYLAPYQVVRKNWRGPG